MHTRNSGSYRVTNFDQPSTFYHETSKPPTPLEALRGVYKERILPLEKEYLFAEFHSPPLTDADFRAKPTVLLVGPYSTGKTSFIRYLMGQDYPGMRIGPEPTTDKFTIVSHSEADGIIPGNALVVDKERQFTSLGKYGNAFLSRLQLSMVHAPILEQITLVDTPGILSGDRERINRGYDFCSVIEWFADRSDLIIVLCDSHKLDMSDEFRAVLDCLKHQHQKVRIVLNKADHIDPSQVMKVHGALLWVLGKVISSPEVPRVFCVSFWDRPYVKMDHRDLFEAEAKELLLEIQTLPRNYIVRKLNDVTKRARLARATGYIVVHLQERYSTAFRKGNFKKQMIKNLGSVYKVICEKYSLSIGDLPDVGEMRAKLKSRDFDRFPVLNRKLFQMVDFALEFDAPSLMASVPKVDQSLNPTFEERLSSLFSKTNPPTARVSCTDDSSSASVTGDIQVQRYSALFDKLCFDGMPDLPCGVVREELLKSKLPGVILEKIWNLADSEKSGRVGRDEFAIAMYLRDLHLQGGDLPNEIPENFLQRFGTTSSEEADHHANVKMDTPQFNDKTDYIF